jgi:hypothetical protein
VIVGVGISPNTQPAAEAGLKADNGVVVNAALATPGLPSTHGDWPTPGRPLDQPREA